MKIAHDAPPTISMLNPAVPPGLASVILRCLEKDRAHRYQSIAELIAALAPFAANNNKVRSSATTAPFAATQAATSWPPEHPGGSSPTVLAGPLGASAAPPPPWSAPSLPPRAATSTSWHHIVGVAFAFGVLMVFAAVVALWPRESVAEAHEAAPSVSSAAPPPVATPSVTASAEEPAPVLSAPPPPPAPPKASVTRVSYQFAGIVYHATIHTNGATGFADVSFIEPGHGPVVVRQDLRLQQGPRGRGYVGSNPRYTDDGSPANFVPSVFVMEPGSSKFVQTCALGTNLCAPLSR